MFLSTFETKLNTALKLLPQDIDKKTLFNILFEMNRYFDKTFVSLLHTDPYNNIQLNQSERNLLRKYYYYGIPSWLPLIKIKTFPKYEATDKDKINVLDSFITRCNTYDKNKIICSLLEKYALTKDEKIADNSIQWLGWFNKKRAGTSLFSLFIYDYCQDDFQRDNFTIDNILKTIVNIYDKLENYRHFAFVLHGKLFNNGNDVT